MTKHQYRRVGLQEVGMNAERRCTDIWAAFVFLVFFGLLMALAGAAFKNGNLKAFVYGTDYMGNVCGGTLPPKVTGVTAAQWSAMSYLWYPIAYDSAANTFHMSSALSMGICVSQCPTFGSVVYTYGSVGSYNMAGSYFSLFNSSSVLLGRCIPNFLSFDCNGVSTCLGQLNSQSSRFLSVLGIGGILSSGVQELKDNLGIVVGLAVLAIVLSFIWLFVLRLIVKPIVVITALALAVAGVAGGAVMFHYYSLSGDTQTGHAWLAGAIIAWIVTFLYLCLLVFLRKDLNSACEIIEESSRVPTEMPKLLIVPLVTAVLMVCFSVFLGATAVAIHTAGTYQPAIVYDAAKNSNVQVIKFAAENWQTVGVWYNLFMFLWTVGYIHALAHLILALCAVLWYWSVPGSRKDPPSNSLSWSTMTTFRYHLGTAALGSFLIALVQFLRILMSVFENRLRVIAERNAAAKILLCCANCCLSCFERVVALLTKNAYVMTAITGEALFPAARQALSLLLSNRAAIAVNFVGEAMLIIGKLLITAIVIFISWIAVSHVSPGQNSLLFCIVMGLTAYFVSSVFATVFSVCIDTVLLSYCVDKEENNGTDRPYYFPESLANHVEEAHRRRNGGEDPSDRNSHRMSSKRVSDVSYGYGQIS